MQETVTLRDGDLERTLPKQRAILRSLTAKAIAGDAKVHERLDAAGGIESHLRSPAENPGDES